MLGAANTTFGKFYRDSLVRTAAIPGGRRELFPLPLPCVPCRSGADAMSTLVIVAFNFLDAGCSYRVDRLPSARKASAGQEEVLQRISKAASLLMGRWAQVEEDGRPCTPASELAGLQLASSMSGVPLEAQRVDLPPRACTCDPLIHLRGKVTEAFASPEALFPAALPREVSSLRRFRGDEVEYHKLTARSLRCGKLRLGHNQRAGAQIFTVGKGSSDGLREVWNGSLVSACAARPPKPPRLGNPGAFPWIYTGGARLYFSKRDAKAYFDLLTLPVALRPYFGRPVVKAGRICEVLGVSLEDLRAFIDDADGAKLIADSTLVPVSACWPMGFSWSSFVAQSMMTNICVAAGLRSEQLMCLECPLPDDQSELATVATDDIILVSHSVHQARGRLVAIDRELAAHGVTRNATKDVDAAGSIIALGCELSSEPPRVDPAAKKLYSTVAASLGLFGEPRCTPLVFASILGTCQWFAQLSRWHFSVFDTAYGFQRCIPQDIPMQVPDGCLDELVVFACLSPLLSVALDRPFCNTIVATDASPSFGFGVSVRAVDGSVVRSLSRCSERHGDHLRMTLGPDDDPELERHGTPVRLPFTKSSFTDVISLKAAHLVHSGALEAQGVLLGVQWIPRSRKRHGHRVIIAIDAKAVLGAVAKGRSSSATLSAIIRRIAAHCLAGGLLLYPIYVPSESNPADAPSRGVRKRPATIRGWACIVRRTSL